MMKLEQIAARIKNPYLCSSDDIESLKQLADKYPYSQSFSLLFLKSLSLNNDIRFDDELKKYAYKISDRVKLYDLIQEKESFGQVDSTSTLYTNSIDSNENTFKITESKIEEKIEIKQEQLENNSIKNEDFEITKESIITNETLVSEQTDELTRVDKDETYNISIENNLNENLEQETFFVDESVIEESLQLEKDLIDETLEFEILSNVISSNYNIELIDEDINSIHETKNNEIAESDTSDFSSEISIIKTEFIEIKEDENETKTQTEFNLIDSRTTSTQKKDKKEFTSWLRSNKSNPKIDSDSNENENLEINFDEKSIKFSSINFDDNKALSEEFIENEPSQKTKIDAIVNDFIKQEPTINRIKNVDKQEDKTKTEFYSPLKKAKLSLDESALPVSETLAKIFSAQGNYPKAIYAYQQLILIYPEKKIFFAKQIKELEQKLNP